MYTNDNPEYVNGRLQQTIIRLNTGVPVYCEGTRRSIGEERREGPIHLWYRPISLSNFGELKKKLIEEFNLSSPPLGYINYEGAAYFVSRRPMRRDWRQGIRQSNLDVSRSGRTGQYSFSSLYPVIIPILKMYPTYKETVDRVEDVYTDCAFTRNFSLDDRGRLWYKGRDVVGEDGGGSPRLFDNFFWLNELLTEEMQCDRTITT